MVGAATLSPVKVKYANGGKPRLIVEMEADELRQLKRAALEADVTVKELVMTVLKRAGLLARGGAPKKP